MLNLPRLDRIQYLHSPPASDVVRWPDSQLQSVQYRGLEP